MSSAPKEKAPTPFMAQYLAAKEKHPSSLLFFRMGDFYEMFFEDAKTAAAALDIALTKRGQHQGDEIPMCGVPAHSVEPYIAKLVRQGFKIAICEQLETPEEAKKRGYKAVVHRDITRIITPGTLTEESLLEAKKSNRLAAIVFSVSGSDAAIAWADVSTGEFAVISGTNARVMDEISGLSIGEILLLDKDFNREESKFIAKLIPALSPRPSIKGDVKSCENLLLDGFGVKTLSGFGDFAKIEIQALGLIYDYVLTTQAGIAPKLVPPIKHEVMGFLAIDAATRNSLEIEKSTKGARKGSLLGTIDKTKTPQGGRQILEDLSRPLLDINAINSRLDAIGFMLENQKLGAQISDALSQMPDMVRPLSRVELNRASPRDLKAIGKSLELANRISAILPAEVPQILANAADAINLVLHGELGELATYLNEALDDELPFMARDGGFIRRGFDSVLDEYVTLRDESRRLIASLSAKVSEQAGQQLKIKFNNVLGYFIEATPKQAPPLFEAPLNEIFIHRQTLSGMVRFTTNELIELNSKTARAADLALNRELELFEMACKRVAELEAQIRNANDAIARLDVTLAAAEIASENNYCRPNINENKALKITQGRHPVVEDSLKKDGGIFTANDCALDAEILDGARLSLITGPNMAGKSTYLRQNAILVIMAQAGFYVPASAMELGLVDRVFSRVGASDDLFAGQSTFMVEMVETANILNRATDRSLVILDEIGRGTATYDGLAIAWAVSEYLHEINKSRALFATHYHELTDLSKQYEGINNLSLSAKEWNGDLIFLHKVIEGAADRSYGVQVAKIAGLPKTAVERAKEVLKTLENTHHVGKKGQKPIDDLPLFSEFVPQVAAVHEKSEAEKILETIDINDLSPRQALELLYELKGKL
jgi:DNA mismatch repair protein MutS